MWLALTLAVMWLL